EDGIRDLTVTGVQTCALPILTGALRVYRWELVKLAAQKRTYLGLGAAAIVPIVFVVVLVLQSGGPNDVPLGRYIRDTGLAVPFRSEERRVGKEWRARIWAGRL